MQGYPFVILGGGVAAGYAAQVFAEHPDYNANDLAIISAEDTLPYDRPPLSKSYLEGESNITDARINSPDFYRQNGIDVFLNTRINEIDPQEKMLYSDDGDGFAYDKLLLATGSHLRTLDVPGNDLDGFHYLRRIGHSQDIRSDMQQADQVVIIGGGYIGMETASVLADSGKKVTMIFPHEHLMQGHFFTEDISEYFEDYFSEHGVSFVRNAEVKEIIGESGRVSSVNTVSRGAYDADLVIAGIGVEPNTDLAEGIRLNRASDDDGGGIEVDSYLQTSLTDVYAAGDIANYPDAIFGKRRRIEHWNNAKVQGEYWAHQMLGDTDEQLKELPYFFSDVFDLSYEFWGDAEEGDNVVYRGDFDDDSISAWWLNDDNLLMAAFVMNRPDEERTMAQEWLRSRNSVPADELANDDEPIYKAV
jgi:NADPH-dependent 2,4-dienoyl-CoA reductase/sulfur reductase-like enzyme